MIDTTHRVEAVSSPRINDRIAHRAVRHVAACAQGDRADIDRRMHSLDREWDVAAERFALQPLRGDFDVPADSGNAYRIMDAVRH